MSEMQLSYEKLGNLGTPDCILIRYQLQEGNQ